MREKFWDSSALSVRSGNWRCAFESTRIFRRNSRGRVRKVVVAAASRFGGGSVMFAIWREMTFTLRRKTRGKFHYFISSTSVCPCKMG